MVDTHEPNREHHRRSASWDLRAGPRNYASLIAAQIVSTGASFVAVWLATRALGSSGYGRVVALIAAAQLVMQLTLQWTSLAVTRYGCEEFVDSGRIAATFWGRLAVLVPNLAVVMATIHWWTPWVVRLLHLRVESFGLVVGYVVIATLWIHVQQALQAAKLPRWQGALLAGERLSILATLIILIAVRRTTPETVAAAYFAAPVLVTAIGVWRLRALVFGSIALPPGLIRRILTFSVPLIPFSIVGYLSSSQLDAIFILRYLTVGDLGRYAVVYQIAGAFMQLPLLAGSLVLPWLVSLGMQRQDEGAGQLLRSILPVLSLAWSMVCVVVAATTSAALPHIFGEPFRDTTPLIWPLMLVAALAGPVLMGYFPVANARSSTYVMAVNAAVGAITNVLLDALLIPRFGLAGCAWASVVASAASFAVTVSILGRHLPTGALRVGAALLPVAVAVAIAGLQLGTAVALAAGIATVALLAWAQRAAVERALVGLYALASRRDTLPEKTP